MSAVFNTNEMGLFSLLVAGFRQGDTIPVAKAMFFLTHALSDSGLWTDCLQSPFSFTYMERSFFSTFFFLFLKVFVFFCGSLHLFCSFSSDKMSFWFFFSFAVCVFSVPCVLPSVF